MNHYGYYFKFNDVPSNDMGLQVAAKPSIPVRNEVIDEYDVLGVGKRYKHRGYYDNIEIPFTCSFVVNENLWMEKLIEIQDFLTGTGTLILSDDDDYYYKVVKISGFDVTRFLEKGGMFEIIFEVKPYKYAVSGLYWQNLNHNIKKLFENNYNKSFPIIKITGETTNLKIELSDTKFVSLPVTSGEVIIDTERGIITKDGVLASNLERITGIYGGVTSLYLDKGTNEILVTGTGGVIEIQPNWRY